MGWDDRFGGRFLRYSYAQRAQPNRPHIGFGLNESCFIRKEHECGKLFGASKSCFIACPTQDDLEPILELISEKLSKVSIEPIIAVKERAYGQDIFCTKICGKIIESRFCIVILDDTVIEGANIPNPNVYYEYGLMTSLRKHIIPLQQDNLDLAFNIQSYDTIKYSQKKIGAELDRAIRDAIRITEEKESKKDQPVIQDKSILRKLELAGLKLMDDDDWFLFSVISDTQFKGFDNREENYCAFVGKIDDETEFQDYLEDLNVVLYRVGKKTSELQIEIKEVRELQENLVREEKGARERISISPHQAIQRVKADIERKESYLANLAKVHIVFIVAPELDSTDFVKQVNELPTFTDRFSITCSSNYEIKFNGINIDLTPQFR